MTHTHTYIYRHTHGKVKTGGDNQQLASLRYTLKLQHQEMVKEGLPYTNTAVKDFCLKVYLIMLHIMNSYILTNKCNNITITV